MSRNIIVAALIAAGVIAAPVAQADDTGLMVRARAVQISFDNANNDGLSGVEAKDRWIPEVDFSYFFTKNIAAELVLTYPQTVDIQIGGVNQGKIKALPPSLMAQYHFTDLGAFKPYVGLGLNYTLFMSRDNILNGAATVDQSSFGLAAQVGFDYMFTKNLGLNVDVKYIQMETDVKLTADGTKLGTLGLNPITAGVGVTYKF
jgi:outer membrane protein